MLLAFVLTSAFLNLGGSSWACFLSKLDPDGSPETWTGDEGDTQFPEYNEVSLPDDIDHLCGVVGSAEHREMLGIVRGVTARPHSIPWQVKLTSNKRAHCSGSIIADRWVLTAAHCVVHSMGFRGSTSLVKQMAVVIGDHDRSVVERHQRTLGVDRVVVHAAFESGVADNDIALIRTKVAIPNRRHSRRICLPNELPRPRLPEKTASLFVAGWGDLSYNGDPPKQLQFAEVRRRRCIFEKRSPKTFCASFFGRDTCQGDSGAAIVSNATTADGRFVQYGVTSRGFLCGVPGFPGVYVNILSHLDWISDTIRTDNNTTGTDV